MLKAKKYKIKEGDCLKLMNDIKDKTVDMILCDLPYGVTKNEWDKEIPFEPLWEQYKRVIKDKGAIILFGQNTFTARCIMSNVKMYRYSLVWRKGLVTGFLNANRMPLREHEDIMVFYKRLPTYNPQKYKGSPCHKRGKVDMSDCQNKNNNYGKFKYAETRGDMKFPTSVLEFPKPHPSICTHPTEKPVELLEYLIKTYTNENDVVLDNCMGSGSTGIAALKLHRRFIGYEINPDYFKIARDRIKGSVFDLTK